MSEFDKIIDRRGTSSIKFDNPEKRGHRKDELSLWVADMDLMTAPDVIADLKKRIDHGIFGYTDTPDEYREAVCGWFLRQHGWKAEKEWIVTTPGVVFALATAVRAFTEKGDNVLIQPPVYYPFFNVIRENERTILENILIYKEGRYEIDFEDLERKLSDERTKMMIFCSPHNPVGRVWEKEEIVRAFDLCKKYGVLLVSDEIHCDFTWREGGFTSLGSLDKSYLENAIVCTAPSKTFNLAGLQISNIFVPNKTLRSRFKAEISKTGYDEAGALGLTACYSAYTKGEKWLSELKTYLKGNIDFLNAYVKENIPVLKVIETQGTYLVWIDFGKTGLSGKELDDFIREKAGLWLDDGSLFGKTGASFQRINIACSREYLKKALERLKDAINSLA